MSVPSDQVLKENHVSASVVKLHPFYFSVLKSSTLIEKDPKRDA